MSTLTKLEIAQVLRAEEDINGKDAKRMVAVFFETITHLLLQGEGVKLFGFGQFVLRHKNARPGRNPRTGEAVAISKRRVVIFKAGKTLKERVNKGN